MVRQNPTMIAALLAIGLAAGAVQAQPFQLASDGADGVWVVDGGSGEVSWCRLVTPAGAKLVDVFGFDAQVREARPRAARPECEVVRAGSPGGVAFDVAAFVEDPEGYGWVGDVPWRDRLRPWETRGDVGGGSHRGDVGYVRGR